jgi:hypothetical protein
MPNYYLVEERHLSPPQASGQGLPAQPTRIGFLDFMRELQQDTFSFTQYQGLRVDGLEDVLLAARPKMDEMADNIRKLLKKAASDLDRKFCADIQIIFHGQLQRGEVLWVDHVTDHRIPIHRIFGSPPAEHIGNSPFYRASFNLSSGV